ncbi:CobW family GTP-binding protein [Neptuniibacter halophilus]|uniref:CobW family GTP-binding protein n=1 Tax=Neptuniibacter halophilus TaxID=651666 RepID=UPI002573F6F1|nr:GTP-binding protein [Neptuniibacter halophilus]
MHKLNNIPTNLITGFLGVGKTTAINRLLEQKPETETWAILVNEFGQIGIDQATLPQSSNGLILKELPGGCICCAQGPALSSTLTTLIRRTRPDRLLIEPTGIGHPAGIIDLLQGAQFNQVLSLQSVICLLDPRALDQPEVVSNPSFQDQLNLADLVLINKTDLASSAQLSAAREYISALYPAKQHVLETTRGELDPALLDHQRSAHFASQFPLAHQQTPVAEPVLTPGLQLAPLPGAPFFRDGQGTGLFSAGWVFNPNDKFRSQALFTLLDSLQDCQRAKGVFYTDRGWLLYNRVGEETDISPIAYRRDSRLELISHRKPDWHPVNAQLMACLMQP